MSKAEDSRDGLPPITTLSRAVRYKCKWDCCNGLQSEVDACTITKCPLYNFRKGRYAFKEKKFVSEENRLASKERFKKAKEAKNG